MTTRRAAFAALSTALVAVVVLAHGHARGPRLIVELADARGLVGGADVRLAGARVGRVEDVRLGADGFPVARVQLDRGVEVRRGARVALRLASLSGERNRYLALDPGDGPPLPDGAALSRSATRSPVELDDALSALGPRTRADVRGVLGELRAGTGARGPQVAAALRWAGPALGATADALRDARADGFALRSLVRDSRTISAALAAGRGRVGDAADRIAALLHATAMRADALRTTVAALPGTLGAADETLRRARTTVPAVDELVRTAAPGLARLPRAARRGQALVRAAWPPLATTARLAAEAPAQLRALRPLVRAAPPVLDRLTPVLRRVAPMLDQSRVRLPDFFSFFSAWADFTADYDANGHAARVGIVLPPAPTRRASADDLRAGELAKPYLRLPGALEGEPWRDYAQSFVAGKHG